MDDESIHASVRSIVTLTILSIMKAGIAGLQDPSWRIRQPWRSQEEPNGDGGPHAHNVTPNFNYNTAARCIKLAIKLHKPTLFCVVYPGQQADCTSRNQLLMHGGHSYHPLDDILPPPTKDMINNIREGSGDDADM